MLISRPFLLGAGRGGVLTLHLPTASVGYMPYKTGYWGEQAQERNKKRLAYFREYYRAKGNTHIFRLGEFGELLAHKKLNGSKLTNQTSHDLIWNGQRIEVKTSETEIKHRYSFDIRVQKREGKTDFFFILILDEITRELLYAYLIPDKAITAKCNLSIHPGRSKYDGYQLKLKPTGAYGK